MGVPAIFDDLPDCLPKGRSKGRAAQLDGARAGTPHPEGSDQVHEAVAAEPDLPRVTVVIPAYNMEQFVERSIRSALAQTYAPLDVLVVDDGSTDRTLEIATRIAEDEPRLQVVSFPNGGVARARNRGTVLAEGIYVAYLDGDDLWHPTKIEKQVAALQAVPPGENWAGCYTLFRKIDEEDRIVGSGFGAGWRGDFFFDHLLLNNVGNGSSLLVRRDAALSVGGFDPTYAERGITGTEDFDFQLKLLLRYRLEVVPEFLVGYRLHPRQMSANLSRMALGHMAVVEKFVMLAQLDGKSGQLALVTANKGACASFAKAHDWANVRRSALKIYGDDRSAALVFGLNRAALGARRILARLADGLAHGIGRVAPRAGSPRPDLSFHAIDPRPGIGADRRPIAPGSRLWPEPLIRTSRPSPPPEDEDD